MTPAVNLASACRSGEDVPLAQALAPATLLSALASGGAIPEGTAPAQRTLALGDQSVAFENAATLAYRIRETGRAPSPDAARGWLPAAFEVVAVAAQGAPIGSPLLLIGGHTIEPRIDAPPSPPYPEGMRAFRFALTPMQAAAWGAGTPTLGTPAGDFPLPDALALEVRRDFPPEFNVPLTLIEF